jgi:ATP-dependent Lon protease
MSSTVQDDADRARHVYGDRVVDKQLANQETFARLPRYVTEYSIAKFVQPGRGQEGIATIKERIKGRIPEADQKEVIKNRLLRDGKYVVIDQLEAEVDLQAGRKWARLNCLHGELLAIDDGLVDRFETLWLLLARLVPLVERNVNLIELGPRGTGKTFLLRNVSPTVFTISGGRPSPATLFVNKQTQRVGILGQRKVIVFDEIAATTFPDNEVVATLKDYMESGEFSRGARKVASDASIVLTGNLDVTGEAPSEIYTHLFEELPTALIDAAFLDRLHGYIPGWEIPKVSHNALARGTGFVIDYFGEVLRALRNEDVSRQFDDLRIEAPATVRDERGVRRIAGGMLKLLFPDGRVADEDRRMCLRFGAELRQRVHNQLTYIAPGEFARRAIAFSGMTEQDARDLVETQKVQQRDARANREAIVGQVTGMVALERQGVSIGGDVFFIEVSNLPGRTGLSITGLRGKVLDDSVRTAFQTLKLLPVPWRDAADHLTGQTAVHLVNIADPKDGPSAGVAFVTGMVSAALNLPVRPGLAMTGEVSLHGHVGAVGGIAQKIVAAAYHQRRIIIIPASNAADLRDVPDDVLGKIEVVTVERVEEVLQHALLPTGSRPLQHDGCAELPPVDRGG